MNANFTVHGFQKGHADDKRVVQARHGESSDGRGKVSVGIQVSPKNEKESDDAFGNHVGGDEFVVHGIRVHIGYETEAEKWHDEITIELVYDVTILRFENVPPPH